MADDKPIIVIKKKGGHGGAHGGAWKIAYADLVTAMMAFFMVMWLLNTSSEQTKQAIASYFRRPGLFQSGSGTPLLIGESGILQDGQPPAKYKGEQEEGGEIKAPPKRKEATDVAPELAELIDLKIKELKEIIAKLDKVTPDSAAAEKTLEQMVEVAQQKEEFQKAAEQIKEQIAASPELKELLGAVDVKVDADGLNIEIMDTEKSSMFALGSAAVAPEAREAFIKISGMIKNLPNSIDIVGHTDAKPFKSATGGYSNWELSTDRANAARKLLEAQGIEPGRFRSVIGRADQELKMQDDPFNASNRRITLKMRYNLNKAINLAKDPAALEKLEKFEETAALANDPKKPKEAVHSFTVKDIVEEVKKQKAAQIRGEDTKKENDLVERDKIFESNPVISPQDFFGQ